MKIKEYQEMFIAHLITSGLTQTEADAECCAWIEGGELGKDEFAYPREDAEECLSYWND